MFSLESGATYQLKNGHVVVYNGMHDGIHSFTNVDKMDFKKTDVFTEVPVPKFNEWVDKNKPQLYKAHAGAGDVG